MAPKQKGGCLDTLDTPWIRHCACNIKLSKLSRQRGYTQ